jgi:hypothetical protein
MRAVGLAFLLFGALAFSFPMYDQWVRWIALTRSETMWVGGLLVACGALALAIYRRPGS